MGKRRRIVAICLFLILIWNCGMTVYAATGQEGTTKIKVAFYQLDGFFEYDEEGNRCGYGVDYLNELKKYMDVDWEYVDVDSWEKIGPMLRSGEVDARMPVSEPSKSSTDYSYTTEDILPTYHAIMTLKTRNDLYYEDYEKFVHMKIAVTDGQASKTGMMDYLRSIGVEENLVYYSDYNSCRTALDHGDVDGVVSNIMDLTQDMKILDKFAVSKTYITTLKNSEYYTMINNAMTELQLENPSFRTDLYKKYYPERAVEPFTKAETEYIKNKDSLKVAVYTDRKPVSYYDTKTSSYQGIAIDLANRLSEIIGIDFTYIPITTDTPEEMLEDVDLVMPVAKAADNDKYFVTTSLVDTNISIVAREGDKCPEQGERVGTLRSTSGIRNRLIQQNYECVTYNTNEEALQALQRGEIDAFANASYILNWLMENPRYANLHLLPYSSIPLEYLMCGTKDQSPLQSILNKGMKSITDEEKENVIKNDTNYNLSDLSFWDKAYINRQLIIAGIVIFLVILLFVMVYNRTRTQYIREIEQKSIERENANHAKSSFLSRMSHDMRTPMNAIIGMSYLGMKENSLEETKDYLHKINQSGKYLLGLINDTLDMSKMDNDKMVLHPEPYYATEFIDSIHMMFAQKMKEKNIHFTVNINNHLDCALMFDKLRLQQIFVNLINNAMKFSEVNGTVNLDILVNKVTEGEVYLTFLVSDKGCGMTKEFQKKMYEPFEQGTVIKGEAETGTGLGLSIVKRLVELMGGTITCSSVPGEGTTFTIQLSAPIYDGEVQPVMKHEDIKEEEILHGKHVLLCEDHPLNIMISRKILEKEKMVVDVAENGVEGIDMFSESKLGYYDVILMDIRMPIMDGIEATEKIRALERRDAATIPIIAMTANAFDEDVEATKKAGMNAHLAKPIDVNELYRTLIRFLTRE